MDELQVWSEVREDCGWATPRLLGPMRDLTSQLVFVGRLPPCNSPLTLLPSQPGLILHQKSHTAGCPFLPGIQPEPSSGCVSLSLTRLGFSLVTTLPLHFLQPPIHPSSFSLRSSMQVGKALLLLEVTFPWSLQSPPPPTRPSTFPRNLSPPAPPSAQVFTCLLQGYPKLHQL